MEQNIVMLTSKLENLQLNFLSALKTQPSFNSQDTYICDICDYKFNDKLRLKDHKQSEHKPHLESKRLNHLLCDQCSNRGVHDRDLNSHKRQMHKEFQQDHPEVLFCKKCNFSTQHNIDWSKHRLSLHKQHESLPPLLGKDLASLTLITLLHAIRVTSRPNKLHNWGHTKMNISRQDRMPHRTMPPTEVLSSPTDLRKTALNVTNVKGLSPTRTNFVFMRTTSIQVINDYLGLFYRLTLRVWIGKYITSQIW